MVPHIENEPSIYMTRYQAMFFINQNERKDIITDIFHPHGQPRHKSQNEAIAEL